MQHLSSKLTLASVVAGTMLMSSVAYGDVSVNIANGQSIFTQGKGDVPACTSCHGENGMGNDSLGAPRLAGQIYQFIRKQLEDFASDKRQDTTMFVMNANAKGLSKQDRMDVAAYVSSLSVRGEPSNLEELAANGTEVGTPYLGKALVNFGDVERQIPACKSCHGYNGRGVDPVYPRIGEQKYTYLVNQLNKWRDGSRANDPLGQMRAVAKNLTDEDIRNIAAYLTGASPFSRGDTQLPKGHVPFEH